MNKSRDIKSSLTLGFDEIENLQQVADVLVNELKFQSVSAEFTGVA